MPSLATNPDQGLHFFLASFQNNNGIFLTAFWLRVKGELSKSKFSLLEHISVKQARRNDCRISEAQSLH